MPGKDHEYGMEFQRGAACPAGDTCNRNIRTDGRAAWVADVGAEVPAQFDFIFFLTAGQDESSTWQEFGPMKFPTKEDVTDEFGPPDPGAAELVADPLRRVDVVGGAARRSGPTPAAAPRPRPRAPAWPSTRTSSATSSASATTTTTRSACPPRRAYTGIWEMLSRGTFNGPGGPHSRWMIPPTGGASMGAQHMLRNKIKLGMVDEAERAAAVARGAGRVRAGGRARAPRARSQPGADGLSGVNIALRHRRPAARRATSSTDPFCDGGGYNNYTVEVVDRMGTDSFTPDAGVLLAKTKNQRPARRSSG